MLQMCKVKLARKVVGEKERVVRRCMYLYVEEVMSTRRHPLRSRSAKHSIDESQGQYIHDLSGVAPHRPKRRVPYITSSSLEGNRRAPLKYTDDDERIKRGVGFRWSSTV